MTAETSEGEELKRCGDALRGWLESQDLVNRGGIRTLILELACLVAAAEDPWHELGLACAALTTATRTMIKDEDEDEE